MTNLRETPIPDAPLGKLGMKDWLKTLAIFIISVITSAVLDAIIQLYQQGIYLFSAIHWNEIGFALIIAVLAYIQKNLVTNSNDQILTKEPEKASPFN